MKLMSIKVNRCRQGKRRRIRNIKLKKRDGQRSNSMPLGAFQSLVVLFELLSCDSSTLRSIWGSFSPISNKNQLKISPFIQQNNIQQSVPAMQSNPSKKVVKSVVTDVVENGEPIQ